LVRSARKEKSDGTVYSHPARQLTCKKPQKTSKKKRQPEARAHHPRTEPVFHLSSRTDLATTSMRRPAPVPRPSISVVTRTTPSPASSSMSPFPVSPCHLAHSHPHPRRLPICHGQLETAGQRQLPMPNVELADRGAARVGYLLQRYKGTSPPILLCHTSITSIPPIFLFPPIEVSSSPRPGYTAAPAVAVACTCPCIAHSTPTSPTLFI
jgi:hypothetical protein